MEGWDNSLFDGRPIFMSWRQDKMHWFLFRRRRHYSCLDKIQLFSKFGRRRRSENSLMGGSHPRSTSSHATYWYSFHFPWKQFPLVLISQFIEASAEQKVLWGSAIVLSRFLAAHHTFLDGTEGHQFILWFCNGVNYFIDLRVVEVGAGCGLAGILTALCGKCAEVMLTDGEVQTVFRLSTTLEVLLRNHQRERPLSL